MPPPTRLQAVDAAIAALRRIPNPRLRIASIRRVTAELDEQSSALGDLLREAILELRAATPPATWQEIGDLLGVSAQRAFQLAEKTTTTTSTKEPT